MVLMALSYNVLCVSFLMQQHWSLETRYTSAVKLMALIRKVLFNVMQAATTYGVTFAVMYDVSGAGDDMFEIMMNDWEWIVGQGITNSSAYQYHNDRPVVCIWGFGFSDREIDHDSALNLVQWFRDQQTVQDF